MSFNFGAPTTTAAPGFAFSSTASFGAPQQQNPPAFGTSQSNVPTFGNPQPVFGTPQTNVPAFGTIQSTTSAFGVPQTSAPAFGTTQTSAPAFGAPAFGTTQTSAPAFGSLQTSTPAFGAIQQPQTAAPAFGFGTTQQQPAFGAPSFGVTTTTTTTAAVAPSFGFSPAVSVAVSVPTTQPPAFGSFGLSTPAQPTLPTFGSTPVATTTATLGFPSLAKPANVTFGAATTAPGTLPSFGLGTTTTTNPMSTTSAVPGTGFNFSAPAGQLSFGAAPTTTTAAPTGGLFGLKTTSGVTFNTTTATSAVTTSATQVPKVGLGGFDVSASQPKTVGRSESVRAKDSQMPQEILCTVEMLKSHIKQQKTISSNIARTSTRKLFNVNKELQNCDLKLSEISNYVANNYAAIKSLRSETATAIRQAEMAQRTHETPPGLQFENTAPLKYFLELVQKFESEMLTFRNQVTLTEKHIRSLTNPQGFSTADDLKKGLQEMHESFIALAGRVHETHQKVEELKEQYLNLRKHKLKDNSNVFEEKQTATWDQSSSMGPTPFSTLAGANLSMNYVPHQAAWTQTQPNQENVFGVGQSNFGNNNQSSNMGTGNAFGSINSTDAGFSLQKPPVGLKRNKH